MLEYDFTPKFIDEVVHRFLIGEQIAEIADDTYNPVEDIEELIRQRMSKITREIDVLKKVQNNAAAPAADVVQVVRCRDCYMHGNCYTEEVFEFAGMTDGFCCVGRRNSNDPYRHQHRGA